MKTFVLGRREPVEPQLSQDYRGNLNPQQYRAVTHKEGPALVIAGAGTGKTRVLTWRVAWLVDVGVPADQILLLTFTRRAAEEMIRRAGALVGDLARGAQGGTFHAFAHRVLREYAPALGFGRSFSVLDESDAEDTLDLLRADFVQGDKRFPRKGTLRTVYSAMSGRGWGLEEAVAQLCPQFAEHMDALGRLHTRWEDHKKAHHLMDFDDLLLHLRTLLRDHPDVAQTLRRRHRYLMVDEYHDTSPIQGELVRLLAGPGGNVVAVGDEAQAIYGFRGADVRNILDFPTHFPGAALYPLEQNYRSTRPILTVANALMAGAREGYRKSLFTSREGGELPLLVACPDPAAQASFVAEQILAAREAEVPLADQAVLFRSARQSAELEIELLRRGIPFRKFGGQPFFDAAHVKDVLAHLRVFQNPGDRVSWHRILKLLPGVGARTAASLGEWLGGRARAAEIAVADASPRARAGLLELGRLFTSLEGQQVPAEQLASVMNHYRPWMEAAWDDHPRRWRDLEYLIHLASRFHTLPALLTELTLEPPLVGRDARPEPEEDVLTLSTVHSAKGLEWQAVYLLWAADGFFPSRFALMDPEGQEEERRLMYVAVTRARKQLMLTWPEVAVDRGIRSRNTASRFLLELPESILEPARVLGESGGVGALPEGGGTGWYALPGPDE